jgi:hypothetical protein
MPSTRYVYVLLVRLPVASVVRTYASLMCTTNADYASMPGLSVYTTGSLEV